MATDAQINANRQNARKSTGPRTAGGKAVSSRNGLPSVTHFLAEDGADPADFFSLLQDLDGRFQPFGPAEEGLVLRIAIAQWRLHRAIPFEAGIFRDRLRILAKVAASRAHWEAECREEDVEGAEYDHGDPATQPPSPEPTPPAAPDPDLLTQAFINDGDGPNHLARLARHESHLERSIDRCLRLLARYQAARRKAEEPQELNNITANPKNGGGVPANEGARPLKTRPRVGNPKAAASHSPPRPSDPPKNRRI
ncbi:MAG TPA: hypothetical protein VKR61_17135 [Bryobacteraceae bacterium]|nr:hypothetical protein [Bryobacteraceae bacterium]